MIDYIRKLYEKKTTIRHALGAAPEDMCTGISDYSSQELRAIACIGMIERMIKAFFSEKDEPFLIRPDTGEKYVNPASDLHTMAATAMYPELKDVPPWDLIAEAKKDMPGGWKRRTRGKICGFTVVYGGSANRISVALQIPIEQAQRLLDSYFELFPELKEYLEVTSGKAKAQKWVQCPVTGRRYFVGETNAKGLGDDGTVERKACNTLIQGISAIMTKKAAWYVDQRFEELNAKYSADIACGKHGRIVALVHDEIVSYIPTAGKLVDFSYSEKKKVWVPKWEYTELAHEFARAQEDGMKQAMDELLQPLVPDFPSKADCGLGSSWAAK